MRIKTLMKVKERASKENEDTTSEANNKIKVINFSYGFRKAWKGHMWCHGLKNVKYQKL